MSTDIAPNALRSARENAKHHGVDDIIETRLVPRSNRSAYSVIGDDERFDIIISNPPYALDLDARTNSPLVDRGDLGLSLIDDLDKHT